MLNGDALPEVSSGENGGYRGVPTQPPAEQDHQWQQVVLQNVRQTHGPVLSADYRDPCTWGPSSTCGTT